MLTWSFILIATVLSAAAGTVALGQRRWQRETSARRATMRAACLPASVATYDRREIEALPPPVKRYFEVALQDGQAMVTSVRFAQQGQFRQDEKKDTWQPFRATQLATMYPPGFDWDARIRMAPGVDVWVRDTYALGAGSLRASVGGLVTVADLHDTVASARGELMRYLAEAAWYPTALLPSQGVRWTPVDERSARATLADGPLSQTLLFRFNGDGLVDSVRSDARGGLVDGKMVTMPWECSMSGYTRRNGMMVPDCGEAAWMQPAGRKSYFRGTLTSLAFDFAP